MTYRNRIHCGALNLSDVGHEVLLAGWVDALREHNQSCADTPVTPGRVAGLLAMLEKDEINANAARDRGGHERALLMVALDLQLRDMPEVYIPVSNPTTDFQTMQGLSNISSTGWK